MIILGRWAPLGGTFKIGVPSPGDLIAINFRTLRHKAWRVAEVSPHEDNRARVILRPNGPTFDYAQYNVLMDMGKHATYYELTDHYPVCVKCGDLCPCSDQWSESQAAGEMKRAERYEVAGVCPACQQPVSSRQKHITFDLNVVSPIGPPVTFHMKNSCWRSAIDYDKAVAKATDTKPKLSCTGHLIQHHDDSYSCSEMVECPGSEMSHGHYARCYVSGIACNHLPCIERNNR
ncbi:hypothetical protein D6T64_11830 [Cryobacterium melibiosiphilum]|uniref:Uncharacterized protein n=1 Tax=Cryobacterium melibiosiphilum TaxID=995039 RepID=A0A3A5MF67_9MICO|nr:hypothetical protein [Cryobacterium melibiosiphilum]RJT88072.1 hypothetical protein D6T64_11830 [Cryobacterium melibiosiphilum]